MQFLIIAYDGTDELALQRRMNVREAHLAGVRQMKTEGTFIEGGAILDESSKMIGSMMLVEFASETAMKQWLDSDPYVTGNVWEKVEIKPFRRAVIS